MKTKVSRHPRKGTKGVKSHDRKISSQRKTVPHSIDEDWELFKIGRKLKRLEKRFDKLTSEKDNIIAQLSGVGGKNTFRSKEDAHARIREIDQELGRIGAEWGMLGKKTKGYFVKRGTQIEKFVDKHTQD